MQLLLKRQLYAMTTKTLVLQQLNPTANWVESSLSMILVERKYDNCLACMGGRG